jgi:hypothetical protein
MSKVHARIRRFYHRKKGRKDAARSGAFQPRIVWLGVMSPLALYRQPFPPHAPLSPIFQFSQALAIALALLVAASAKVNGADASAAVASATALPIDQPPIVDGVLDDACWSRAPKIDGFRQVDPKENAAPSEQTEVQFVFDANALYVGVRCFDDNPGGVLARSLERDTWFDSDDRFIITLDTFHRALEGYYFAFNPLGARTDAVIQNNSEIHRAWDGIWEVRTHADAQGWTAEVKIPFKSLAFNPQNDVWGLNLERLIRRKQEKERWSGYVRARDVSSLAEFGQLHGLKGLRQGLGLELKPYASLRYVGQTPQKGQSTALTLRGGFDTVWNVTPSLAATLTINTDFAEADVDERRVNLSRFALFFPEKRDFFLRDAALFSFGGLGDDPSPFFSRRIGLSPTGQPLDILAGLKVAGRTGPFSIGLLDAQVESGDGIPEKNLLVTRVTTKVLDQSTVGVLLTHGDPRGPGNNTLGGADFNYLDNRLIPDKTIIGHAWVMATDSDAANARDLAAGFSLAYPNDPFDAELYVDWFGEKFDPALGFVDRTGVRDYQFFTSWTWHPNTYLREIQLSTRPAITTDLGNRLIGEDHDLLSLSLRNSANDEIWLETTEYGDRLDEAFEIRPGIPIAAGYYRYPQVKVGIDTADARGISGSLQFQAGNYYSGTKRQASGGIGWRPNRHWLLSANYEVQHISLPTGAFSVAIASGKVNLAFTPDLSLSTLAQYDNISRRLGVNVRLKWTVRPGCDSFVVLNQGYIAREQWRLSQESSEAIVKAGWTWRF